MATAQNDNAFIYDYQGLEAHQLNHIIEPQFLEYLRNHMCLVSLTKRGKLCYTDVSTGQIKAEIKTYL